LFSIQNNPPEGSANINKYEDFILIMKTRNIIALVLILIGVISAIYLTYGPCPYTDYASCGFGRGMMVVGGAYPLILIGVLIFVIGWIVDRIKSSKKKK